MKTHVTITFIDMDKHIAEFKVKDINLNDLYAKIELFAIYMALEKCGGSKHKAAKLLGVNRTNLYKKLKALGLHK